MILGIFKKGQFSVDFFLNFCFKIKKQLLFHHLETQKNFSPKILQNK
jgi:hypothetical protein